MTTEMVIWIVLIRLSREACLCRTDCANGADDDGDGLIDCLDSECFSLATCLSFDFDGSYGMDLTLTDNNIVTDDCVGTLTLNLTEDGYEHASLVGSGSCTSTALGTISVDLNGYAIQVSSTQATLSGLITQELATGERFYSQIQTGTLLYDQSTNITTIEVLWQTQLPLVSTGGLLATSGELTY